MWNTLDTGKYYGMTAETVDIKDREGNDVRVYYSRPLNAENVPGIVLIPHMPGWDELMWEFCRRFTQHGYAVVCPDIYRTFGHGKPAEVSAAARAAGGVYDRDVMRDVQGAIDFLKNEPASNTKVGVIGTCSGGRHTFLAACTLEGIDAAVDCWGGGVAVSKDQLKEQQPVAPIDYVENLSCPLLGIFGNDDGRPNVDEVNYTEDKLKEYHKDYEFHRYDGAGHGIWYYQGKMYRPEAAMDSWEKALEFFEKHLKKE